MSVTKFHQMIGVTMKSVSGNVGDDVMEFTTKDGKTFRFLHHQDFEKGQYGAGGPSWHA